MPNREALLKMFNAGRLHTHEPEHLEFIKFELAALASSDLTKGDYEKYSQIYNVEMETKVKSEPEAAEPEVESIESPKKKPGRPKKV